MRSYIVLLFVTVAVLMVWGEDNEQAQEQIKTRVKECFKKCNITKSEVENAKTEEVDTNEESNKCKSTCMLKCLDLVDHHGKINENHFDHIITKLGKKLDMSDHDTQRAKNGIKDCAEKMKAMKVVGCEVGRCVANTLKAEWKQYINS